MHKKETFIEKAIKKHGNKYDYSKVEYINCKTKVCIICPIHGEFWQTPDNHLQNSGCKKCARESANKKESLSTKEFIEKAKQIHGNKYDYSKVIYKDMKTKVCIICPMHGEFWQTPANHTNKLLKSGCPKCKAEKLSIEQKMEKEEFIKKAKKIHGDKYDYSEVIMNGLHSKIKIFCKKCNKYFYQEANSHLRGRGCPHCANKTLSTFDIVNLFKSVHGNKYDYSKVIYKGMKTKVCIICPVHGEFWQTPYNHFKMKQGCPSCKESHLENEIRTLLEKYNIKFDYDKSRAWLNKQRLDFYLPEYNVAIECQGIQHFKPTSFSSKISAETAFKKLRKLDTVKYIKCKENNIKLLYFTDLKYKSFLGEKVFSDKDFLIKEILNH